MGQAAADQSKLRDFERPQAEDQADADIDRSLICDEVFLRDLDRLKKLRAFVQNNCLSAVIHDPSVPSFSQLNMLRYDSVGRHPTAGEWAAVDSHTQALFALLNEPLRRKFSMGELPRWLSIIPLILIFFGVSALTASILVLAVDNEEAGRVVALPLYLIWIVCLGALGAVAFIAMNALSVQTDVTFDLTNVRLIWLRLVLGALFGVVLTLPFGYEDFIKFCTAMAKGPAKASVGSDLSRQTVVLLLPFILGFSTTVVIMILNQFVEAVQSFFGRRPQPPPTPQTVVVTPAAPLPAAPLPAAPLAAVQPVPPAGGKP